MKFENAMVAMRKGFKVQRKSAMNRLNAVCFYIEGGKIITEQTHELSNHKKEPLASLSNGSIMSEDWVALK